jgi:glycosyltransferase involved in cell wall biosynthesis
MKILMIGLYPPHVGGIASYVYYVKRALEKLDFTVYVVTYGKADHPDVYGTNTWQRLRGVSFLVSGVKRVCQVAKKKDIDVLHAHYLVPPGLVGVFSKKRLKIPLVVTCHGSDVFVFSTGWKKMISEYVVESADRVTCNSTATLRVVKELGNTGTYVPSGVDLNVYRPLDLEREAVTYVGALTETKGVDMFLKAMEGIPAPVWVIGDGPERKTLEMLAKSLGLSCTFWGFRKDVSELMNRSQIVVLPSRNEGFGLTLLEAMACGTPVIGRKTGGIPEVVTGENGLLFETEEELHQKVMMLLEDLSLWNQLREEGLKTASQWSWEKTARSYAELYSDL